MKGISTVSGKIEKLHKEMRVEGSRDSTSTSYIYYFVVSDIPFALPDNNSPLLLKEGDDVKVFYQSDQKMSINNHYYVFDGIINYSEKLTHYSGGYRYGIVFAVLLSIFLAQFIEGDIFDSFVSVLVLGIFYTINAVAYYFGLKEFMDYYHIKEREEYIKGEINQAKESWKSEMAT